MADINLLPWRAAKRSQQAKRCGIYLFFGLLLAASTVFLIDHVVLQRIQHQIQRNQRLVYEIAQCKKNKAEVNHLDARRTALLLKINTLQRLRAIRTLPVHFLYELMTIIPEGVSVNQVEKRADKIILIGFAKSSRPISQLMRNIVGNPLIHESELPEIKATTVVQQPSEHEFKLTFRYKGGEDD